MALTLDGLAGLVADLQALVATRTDAEALVASTSSLLETFLVRQRGREHGLPQAHADRYARHLIFRHPDDLVSVVAMIWGPGQSTAIHDHDGIWCVEGVLEGQLKVSRYDPIRLPDGRYRMIHLDDIHAGQGAVGNLIPPFEHHRISNPATTASISIHVYGRDLQQCRRYMEDADGLYREEIIPLCYDSDLSL